jgi:hypothetical protein
LIPTRSAALAIFRAAAAERGRPDESSRRTRPDDGAIWRMVMDQLVQVFGSLLILVAFAAAQRGTFSTHSRSYLLLNLVGSTILTILAAHERQWGFLLLESCWAVVAGWGLLRNLRGHRLTARTR